MDNDITKSRSGDSFCGSSQIATGKLNNEENNHKKETSDGIDWSQPVVKTTNQTADAIDWSTPSVKSTNPFHSTNPFQSAGDMDWGQPVTKFDDEELDLTLDMDDHDTKSDSEIESRDKLLKGGSLEVGADAETTSGAIHGVYKFN